jgi:hypothetical protein
MDIEIWKPVVCYQGLYEVSNTGRIRSKIRNIIMKQATHRAGYYYLGLRDNGEYKKYLVHRLVAEAFIPNPDNLPFVDHIDRDKQNNNVNNLRWTNKEGNSANRIFKGYTKVEIPNKYGSEYTYYLVCVKKDGVKTNKYCKTEEEARQTYEKLHKEIHGEFSPY